MIRWTNTTTDPMGQFESLLVGLSPDDRDQAMAIWSQERIHSANRAARRRDAQGRQYIVNLCWSIVILVVVFAAVVFSDALDSPNDHMGPDELGHIARGHRIGGVE